MGIDPRLGSRSTERKTPPAETALSSGRTSDMVTGADPLRVFNPYNEFNSNRSIKKDGVRCNVYLVASVLRMCDYPNDI